MSLKAGDGKDTGFLKIGGFVFVFLVLSQFSASYFCVKTFRGAILVDLFSVRLLGTCEGWDM